ncbi:duf829 domain protein [Moniliophthora roreri]|nr:duf829 domain protein [Moniliophthora roreri]
MSIAHHVHTEGIPKYFPALHAHLCRPDVLPGCTFSTPRLYAYSDTDEVVAHESVEEHLEGIRTEVRV